MGWPRYNEDISPEFWGTDAASMRKKEIREQRKKIFKIFLIAVLFFCLGAGITAAICLR
jgi:NhaP-type Na+/H+ or K+/H+ antiporter